MHRDIKPENILFSIKDPLMKKMLKKDSNWLTMGWQHSNIKKMSYLQNAALLVLQPLKSLHMMRKNQFIRPLLMFLALELFCTFSQSDSSHFLLVVAKASSIRTKSADSTISQRNMKELQVMALIYFPKCCKNRLKKGSQLQKP